MNVPAQRGEPVIVTLLGERGEIKMAGHTAKGNNQSTRKGHREKRWMLAKNNEENGGEMVRMAASR